MSGDLVWRWFLSLSDAELADAGEPILEMTCRADAPLGFEPLPVDDLVDGALPELSLP